jgi:hypothetical protein
MERDERKKGLKERGPLHNVAIPKPEFNYVSITLLSK